MRKLTTEELVTKKPSLEEFRKQKRNPIYVILNNVRSLQNVGLVFRLCDALLIKKLYLCGYTGYPPLGGKDLRRPGVIIHAQNQIAKTAIRTADYVPWEYHPNTLTLVKKLKRQGIQIGAVEQTDASIDYSQADYRFPLALVFGHEREGVESQVLRLADFAVEIPIFGMGNSLNVAMSLAVVGYELIKRLTSNR